MGCVWAEAWEERTPAECMVAVRDPAPGFFPRHALKQNAGMY